MGYNPQARSHIQHCGSVIYRMQDDEASGICLYINGFPPSWAENQGIRLCRQYGRVVAASWLRFRDGCDQGSMLVQYMTMDEAANAQGELDEMTLNDGLADRRVLWAVHASKEFVLDRRAGGVTAFLDNRSFGGRGDAAESMAIIAPDVPELETPWLSDETLATEDDYCFRMYREDWAQHTRRMNNRRSRDDPNDNMGRQGLPMLF